MIYRNYHALWRSVRDLGSVVPSRLGPTHEMIGQTLSVPAGTIVDRPGLNVGLGFVEALMLLAGTFDLTYVKHVAPRVDLSLFTPAAAYGPRVAGQVGPLVHHLRKDRDSRRAVLHVAFPGEAAHERPCTTSVQFLVRGPQLITLVAMRSWDLWLGAPYDLMMFGALAQAVARCLPDTTAKVVAVTAGSAHIYHQHADRSPGPAARRFRLGMQVPHEWAYIVDWARTTLDLMMDGTAPWHNGIPPGVGVGQLVEVRP